MTRSALQWTFVFILVFSSGCWGRSVWADGDGGEIPSNDPRCGNDRIEGEEQCDGVNLAGYTCRILHEGEGTLACSSQCTFDTSGCGTVPPDCGNGVLDANEECDGALLDGEDCWSQGYSGGTLGCTVFCRFDTTQCLNAEFCGNGLVEFGEECDDGNTIAGDGCSPTCQYEMESCGNGVHEPWLGEACEGPELGGATCESLGFSAGLLSCDSGCDYDTSGCTGQVHFLYENFESGASGWTLSGDWEVGVPMGFEDEPSSAYEGSQVLGTRIGQHYSNQRQYMANMAVSPNIDLSSADIPVLIFQGWLSAEECCDGVNVWIRPQGSSIWTHLDNPSFPYMRNINGYQAWTGQAFTQWIEVEFDLSAYVGQTLQIAFAMRTDGSVTQTGAYVDQVIVTETGESPVSLTSASSLGVTAATQPFSAQLSATGGSGAYQWSIRSGGFNNGWLSVGASNGLLSGTPAETNAGPVEVLIRVASQGNPNNYDEKLFYIEVQRELWADTLDGGAVGWTLSGDWEWGTPTNVGPPACHSGSCIGLRMASNYNNNQQWSFCTATSPPIDLTGTLSPTLRFWSFVDTEGATWDGGNLKVSTGGPGFTTITAVDPPYNLPNVQSQPAWGGSSMTGGWQQFEADLSAYAGQTIRIQFAFRSDGSVARAGWYVDDLELLDF